MNIEFNWQGKRVKWIGEPLLSKGPISKNELDSLATNSMGAFFCRFEYVGRASLDEPNDNNSSNNEDGKLTRLLNEFEDIYF